MLDEAEYIAKNRSEKQKLTDRIEASKAGSESIQKEVINLYIYKFTCVSATDKRIGSI
jgi:hypothetical protein